MTIETTPRLALPMLAAGQAQKEVAHNEALLRADCLINPVAEAMAVNTPPASPTEGRCWIAGGAPTGAWAGQAGAMACWTAGGWRFSAPFEGQHVWLRGEGVWAVRGATGWTSGVVAAQSIAVGGQQVVGARRPAIANPSGGATVDSEARTAIATILSTLRDHGLIAS